MATRKSKSDLKRRLDDKAVQVWLELNAPANSAMRVENYCGAVDAAEKKERELHLLTWRHIKNTPLFRPLHGSTWHDYVAEALRARCHEDLDHLKALARSDDDALAVLADFAVDATKFLTYQAQERPSRVATIARQRFLWPFLKAPKERFGDNHKKLISAIRLGADHLFSKELLRRVPEKNLIMVLAVRLLCRLDSWRRSQEEYFAPIPKDEWEIKARRLPPFSEASWRQWLEVGWQFFLSEHEGRPEQHPELRKLGAYRSRHSEYQEQQRRPTTATANANIRDGIHEKLKKAIERLACSPK